MAGVSVLFDSPERSALLNHEPATNLGAISLHWKPECLSIWPLIPVNRTQMLKNPLDRCQWHVIGRQ